MFGRSVGRSVNPSVPSPPLRCRRFTPQTRAPQHKVGSRARPPHLVPLQVALRKLAVATRSGGKHRCGRTLAPSCLSTQDSFQTVCLVYVVCRKLKPFSFARVLVKWPLSVQTERFVQLSRASGPPRAASLHGAAACPADVHALPSAQPGADLGTALSECCGWSLHFSTSLAQWEAGVCL